MQSLPPSGFGRLKKEEWKQWIKEMVIVSGASSEPAQVETDASAKNESSEPKPQGQSKRANAQGANAIEPKQKGQRKRAKAREAKPKGQSKRAKAKGANAKEPKNKGQRKNAKAREPKQKGQRKRAKAKGANAKEPKEKGQRKRAKAASSLLGRRKCASSLKTPTASSAPQIMTSYLC